jgi:hypothetical protein
VSPSPASDGAPSAGSHRIVIVIGPGRSGTSTIAGSLERLGLHVPEPVVGPNETNPSGFYEPRWVVDFHRELLDRAVVHTLDASPAARERARSVGERPAVRRRLQTWLTGKLDEGDQLIVKDPRIIWFRELWVDTARELGIDPGFVTMLRHPAEVSGSRQRYYGRTTSVDEARARADDTNRIAGWVNVALYSEEVTQGSKRIFVRYADLIQDWRDAVRRVGRELDLSYHPGPETSPHSIDDFIDPDLRRIRIDWSDLDVPDQLRDLGERTWGALSALADDSEADAALGALAELREEYGRLEADAVAIARQSVWRSGVEGRRKGKRSGKRGGGAAKTAGPARTPRQPDRSRHGGLWDRLTGERKKS